MNTKTIFHLTNLHLNRSEFIFNHTSNIFEKLESLRKKTCFIHRNCKKHLNQNIQKHVLLQYTVYHKPVRLNSLKKVKNLFI